MITQANDVTATDNLAMTSQESVGSNAIYAFSLGGTGNTVSSNSPTFPQQVIFSMQKETKRGPEGPQSQFEQGMN